MSESFMEIDEFGNRIWRNSEGKYHRLDGPAIVWSNGDKFWYDDGRLHRLNGPAIVWETSKVITWYVNGDCIGYYDKGFWALWERLTPKQKEDPILLSYLPGDFHV